MIMVDRLGKAFRTQAGANGIEFNDYVGGLKTEKALIR